MSVSYVDANVEFLNAGWIGQALLQLKAEFNFLLDDLEENAKTGRIFTSLLTIHLPRVESQIQALHQEITSIAILKAERIWRERGETDAGYLKKSAEQR
ncbi:hypothetical protein G6F47_013066 [Rhizopus delemar]|nr:hypothetical protein G6F47_013066 [Rhizopus delemar]KAG1581053.1 hypothetical protein G6F48_010058 [Rhizopus delemar]KAG1629644.1 hypothetical protein G6F44_011557 [Rhizopus delemar]